MQRIYLVSQTMKLQRDELKELLAYTLSKAMRLGILTIDDVHVMEEIFHKAPEEILEKNA